MLLAPVGIVFPGFFQARGVVDEEVSFGIG